MRTRVARGSGGSLANGRGATISRPARVLDTSNCNGQGPVPRFSMRPRRSHSVEPDMRIVAGKPMKAGNFAPPARP
jgi:hypothetical protein